MGNRGTEEHRVWLFDLAHGNLTQERIVSGFLKFYALEGWCMGDAQDDLVFRTHYGAAYAGKAMERLREALEQAAGA